MEMRLCEVLTPLNRDGERHPSGSSVELPVKDAEALARIQAVKILESPPAQSELTVDPASEVAGVPKEVDGIGEGDEDSEQESDQSKKRGGGKK